MNIYQQHLRCSGIVIKLCIHHNCWLTAHLTIVNEKWMTDTVTPKQLETRSSAIAEGPWDASCQLKSCQLPRNSALVSYLYDKSWTNRSYEVGGYSGAMCNKHVHSTITRSSRFHSPIGVINKLTTDELWISPVYWRLAVAKFSKTTMLKLLTLPWPRPLGEQSLVTRLRLHMADPCAKCEVSSVSHCGDITWSVKF